MVITTELTDENRLEVDRIYRRHHANDFYIPSLRDSITYACATNDNKVIGFGVVKPYPEAILVLDYDASLRDKVQAWRGLLNKAISDTALRHDQLYVSVHDDAHANLLKKHYGFKEVPGKQLYLEL